MLAGDAHRNVLGEDVEEARRDDAVKRSRPVPWALLDCHNLVIAVGDMNERVGKTSSKGRAAEGSIVSESD